MTIKVGINGFGRIGRIVFRAAQKRSDIEIVGINDLLDAEYMAYMLKYDSTHGRFDGTVEVKDGHLVVNGKTIRVTAEKDPANLKWNEIGVDVVAEATGIFLTDETARKHITAGAKKVVLTGPSKDNTPMFVRGANFETYAGQDIVSNASCTTNCLAPLAKALNDAFEIKVGTMTTIHAYTGTQALVDGPRGKDLRASRAAAENIIPHTTGAAKAIGLVIPALSGKLKGHAQRVPVKTGSVTELVAILGKKVTVEEINAALKKATQGNKSFGYTDEEIVSSDVIGSHYGSVFDATQTEVSEAGELQLVKAVAWYDNEYGFVTQLVRTLDKFAAL